MKNFIAGDDGDQNYGDHPDSDHSGCDDRNDDDNNLDCNKTGEELHGRRRHQGDLDLRQAVRC